MLLFYEPEQPATTYVLSSAAPYARGTCALGEWMRSVRGNVQTLLGAAQHQLSDGLAPAAGATLLAVEIAPLVVSLCALHRHAIAHGALTPDAVRVATGGESSRESSGGGGWCALLDAGFPAAPHLHSVYSLSLIHI